MFPDVRGGEDLGRGAGQGDRHEDRLVELALPKFIQTEVIDIPSRIFLIDFFFMRIVNLCLL